MDGSGKVETSPSRSQHPLALVLLLVSLSPLAFPLLPSPPVTLIRNLAKLPLLVNRPLDANHRRSPVSNLGDLALGLTACASLIRGNRVDRIPRRNRNAGGEKEKESKE